MTTQPEVHSSYEIFYDGFDLAPDEQQVLAVEMVDRFSRRYLNFDNPNEEFKKIACEFNKLGVGDLIGKFKDPILIALLCERLGYHGALTALRLILPYLFATAYPANVAEHLATSNIAITRTHAEQIDFIGIVFDTNSPLILLSDQRTLHQVPLSVLPSGSLTQLDLGVSHCAIVTGIFEHGALKSPKEPNQEIIALLPKLVFVVVSFLVGSMLRAVDFGFEYAQERSAFGKAILNHQPVSFRLVDGLMQAEALRLLLLSEATCFQGSQGLKGLAEEAITASSAILRDVLQNCGGHGYVRGIEINTLFETNSVCRALLSSLTRSFLSYSSLEAN